MRHQGPEVSVDRVWRLPAELEALRPDAVGLLDAANHRAWEAVDPALLEQVRLRLAALIGNAEGLQRRSGTARAQGLPEGKIALLVDYSSFDAFSELEKACLAFTEQFVIDVSGITDADRAGLLTHLSEGQARAFVVALYVTECTQRLEMASPALLASSASGSRDGRVLAAPATAQESSDDPFDRLHEVLRHYQEAVVRGTALDPVITEMVRLRCARTHDCRICKTLRLEEALDAGVDDAMTAKVDFYEKSDLAERTKTALRITDAFITRPDMLADVVIGQARTAFSAEELAELLLDITKWSTQKIHVALGTDAADALPKNEQGLSFFRFDGEGRATGFSATVA